MFAEVDGLEVYLFRPVIAVDRLITNGNRIVGMVGKRDQQAGDLTAAKNELRDFIRSNRHDNTDCNTKSIGKDTPDYVS